MSLTQTAFLDKSSVQIGKRLEEAVRGLGFDLLIDDFYQPFKCSGFLPCTLNGKKSGFEIYFDSPDEASEQYPRLKEKIENRKLCNHLSLGWRYGRMRMRFHNFGGACERIIMPSCTIRTMTSFIRQTN